jgi:hypothetical protein
MSTPQQSPDDADDAKNAEAQAPPASPAYSTPPPEGLPSADDDSAGSAE